MTSRDIARVAGRRQARRAPAFRRAAAGAMRVARGYHVGGPRTPLHETAAPANGRNRHPRKHRRKEHTMKRLIALSGLALALVCGQSALAQSSPPPLPQLTPEQSKTVEQRLDAYRTTTEDRVSRGEITPDEADRLIAWREWQIAQQVAGMDNAPPGDVPPDYYPAPAPRDYVIAPPPYYGPYYRYPAPYYPPPYYAPRAYYFGPAVCAGGFGRHFGGRICF
jgi:hypothetical protein